MSADELRYPKPSHSHSQSDPQPQPKDSHSSDYAPYPKLQPNDVASSPLPPHQNLTSASGDASTTMPKESNPYVSPATATAPTSSGKDTLGSVKCVLGKWGKKAAEATKKAEDLAGNMWQHCLQCP